MILRVLPPLDYYPCSECSETVTYQRGNPPEGFAHNLCDSCDAEDRERGARILARTAAQPLPPVRADADVRALPIHLDPFADDLSPREWMGLSEADLEDLTPYLESE